MGTLHAKCLVIMLLAVAVDILVSFRPNNIGAGGCGDVSTAETGNQACNEWGGKRGKIPQAPIHYGGAERPWGVLSDCGGRQKSQKCCMYFIQ